LLAAVLEPRKPQCPVKKRRQAKVCLALLLTPPTRLTLDRSARFRGRARRIFKLQLHTSTFLRLFHSATMKNSIISSIPDELLEKIILIAIDSQAVEPWAWTRRCAFIATLSLTCKRLNYITKPLLYHTICITRKFQAVPPDSKTQLLYRTMEANPDLHKFCKHLAIAISDFNVQEDDFHLCNDLVSWLTNVTTFKVYGGFQFLATYTLIRKAMLSMPQCSELHLSRCWDSPLLIHVFNECITPQLRVLRLHGAIQFSEGNRSDSALIPEVSSCIYFSITVIFKVDRAVLTIIFLRRVNEEQDYLKP